MVFYLNITLGNDAMSTADDVARKLRDVADQIDRGRQYGPVMDDNGNKVGEWSF